MLAVYNSCGKQKNVAQVPLPAANPEAISAVGAIVQEYRGQLAGIVDRAALPQDLPAANEARQTTGLAETTGAKKPVLVRAFKPMGYDCTADSGTFTLRRRTAGNLTVEISLDVGTWSRSLTSHFQVQGIGFAGSSWLTTWLPSLRNWIAVSFVRAVEAASGPSPEWYKPES